MNFPNTFPRTDYEAVEKRIEKYAYSQEWWICLMGWKGLPVRYRMAIEEEAVFSRAIQGAENAEKRYLQERSFFGFITSSLSALSCYSYSLHGLAAMADKAVVPDQQREALALLPAERSRKACRRKESIQT
jgi:hypothetical protein